MNTELISNIGNSLSNENTLWGILLFFFIIMWGLVICLEWRIRENRKLREAYYDLKRTIDIGARNFIEDGSFLESKKRLAYLRKCMLLYRKENEKM
jgi:hypothetical protein